MCVCVCFCGGVCACLHMWVCENAAMYHYYFIFFASVFLLFQRPDPINARLRSCICSSRMLMHCKHLPAGTGGVKREALQNIAQEERRVYTCDYRFDLSPRAEPFVTQTKGGTPRISAALGVAAVREAGSSRLLSQHLATLEVTCFPLRTVYFHRDIFP